MPIDTTLFEKEIAKLLVEAQTRDTSYAIDKGIIHEIRDIQIPTGCPVISLVFKRKASKSRVFIISPHFINHMNEYIMLDTAYYYW